MAHKVIQPGEQQMGFVAQLAFQDTGAGLECFQLATQGISLGSAASRGLVRNIPVPDTGEAPPR